MADDKISIPAEVYIDNIIRPAYEELLEEHCLAFE
jgi:hypothetical protein